MSTTLTINALDVRYGARTLVQGLDLVLSSGRGDRARRRERIGQVQPDAHDHRRAPGRVGVDPALAPPTRRSAGSRSRRRTRTSRCSPTPAVGPASRTRTGPGRRLLRARLGEAGAGDRYAVALEHWLALGGADLEDRLPQVAAQLGLDAHPDRPLGTLSGGQAARAALASVLLSRYEVLLLDEPTNNLDATGLALMVDFVTGHEGPVMVASHDRDFLDRVATQRGRARPRSAADQPPRRLLHRLRRRSLAGAPAGARGLRGVRRDPGPHPRPEQAACRLGREGPPQRQAQRRAGQEHPREAQGPRRPAGREGGAAPAIRGPARRSSTSRARSGSCATRSTRAPSRRRWCGRWTGWCCVAASSSSARSTSPSRAVTDCCSPVTTGPARPRCSRRCSAR